MVFFCDINREFAFLDRHSGLQNQTNRMDFGSRNNITKDKDLFLFNLILKVRLFWTKDLDQNLE